MKVNESEETEVKQSACRYIDQRGDTEPHVADNIKCRERACRQTELRQSGSEPHDDVIYTAETDVNNDQRSYVENAAQSDDTRTATTEFVGTRCTPRSSIKRSGYSLRL